MGNFPDDYGALADPLRRGAFREFVSQAHAWSVATQRPLLHVLSEAMLAFMPPVFQQRQELESALRRHEREFRNDVEHLARYFSLPRHLVHELDDLHPNYFAEARRDCHPSKQRLLKAVYSYAMPRSLQSPIGPPNVLYAHPFAHRPLVEFVLAIPEHTLCQPGFPRALMRRAFAGFMPEKIRARFSKGYAAPYLVRRFRPVARAFLDRFDRLELVRLGYVDPVFLKWNLQRIVQGTATGLGNLAHIVTLEQWLEARRGSTQSAYLN
jgi:hypothetical protein